MVEVHLHGALAKEFGKIWNLDICTPHEAVAAIECGRRGFKAAINKLDHAGMVFRVRSKTHDYDNTDVHTSLGGISRIDIIPIVRGASAGIRFVVGAILTVAGYFVALTGNPLGYGLISAGAGLMLGAVTEWLTPTPKKEEYTDVKSWLVSGPTNTLEQGAVVPVIYGEVLTGGQPISAGIAVAELSAEGSTGPFASIGGKLSHEVNLFGANLAVVVVQLSTTPANVAEPISYLWSFTGFNVATTKDLPVATNSTMRLSLTIPVAFNETAECPGVVSVRVTARSAVDQNESVVINTSVAVKVRVTSVPLPGSDEGRA